MNQIDLQNRIAIVTGGARGIGRAIAERLLASGARVSLWDVDAAALTQAAAELGQHESLHTATVDLANLESVQAATAAAWGRIDILVNSKKGFHLRVFFDPMMKPLLYLFSLLMAFARLEAAEAAPELSRWKEDFSDEAAFMKNWASYGWLADGKVVSGPENMHRWWQIHDGALRGQTFGKLHASGLTRKTSGRDVRVSLRFKLEEGGMAAVGFNGPNPILEANFHLAGVHIRPGSITAWDEENLHPKGSPEAEALKKAKQMNRKFIGAAKVEKIALSLDAWHALVIEMHGKTIMAFIDGKQVLTYETHAGDAPKETVQFAVGGGSKDVVNGWYDDVSFEPLEEKK